MLVYVFVSAVQIQCSYVLQAEVVGVFLQITLLPLELCGFILGMDCGVPYNPRLMWNVTFPPTPKPPVVPPSPPAVST